MSGTALEPSKSIGAFPDVPDLATSGEEAYVYFHIDPKHTNFINRIIEGYEYLGVMTSVDTSGPLQHVWHQVLSTSELYANS